MIRKLTKTAAGKVLFYSAAAVCLAATARLATTLCFAADTGAQETSVQLAALLALSGSATEQGEWIAKGLELGLEKAERTYGRKLGLLIEDTGGDPKTALSAYQSLRARAAFPVVFSYGSGVGVALTPVVNRDHVVQFGLATAAPAYRTPDDYTFRNFPSAELEARFLVRSIHEKLGTTKIGILQINNEYGMGSAKAFRGEFEQKGGTVLFEESIEPGNTDFKSTLLKLKSTPAQFIYLASYPTEGALILKQMRELGITAQVIASVAILGSKNFLELAGAGSEQLLVATSAPVYLGNTEPSVREFVDAYRQKYHDEPGVQHIFAARAYDAALLTAEAVQNCTTPTADCIRDFLFSVKGYHGASGILTFDRNGDVDNKFSLQKIENGKFTAIDTEQ